MSFVTGRHIATEEQALADLKGTLERHEEAIRREVEEWAATWTTEKRRKALKDGNALPGPDGVGRFPIADQTDMQAASRLMGNSSIPNATIIEHMKRMAKKHKLSMPGSGGS